jgi:MFS family permease
MVPRPVALVSAAVALSLLGDSLLYAVLPSQAEAVGVPIGLVGVVLSANRFIRLLSNPWAGSVCDRLGYARPFTAALLLGAATTAVYGMAYGFWGLFFARVLWGVSWSFLRVGGLGTVLEHATARDRGLLMGFFLGISRLGSLVAVALGGGAHRHDRVPPHPPVVRDPQCVGGGDLGPRRLPAPPPRQG